jgi:hypothetical protein
MKTAPTDPEINHAISLLREVPSWDGRIAIIPIDPICLWDAGEGPCGEHLEEASVLLQEEEGSYCAHVLVLCKHHAQCMEAGVTKWRTLS